MTRKPEIQYVGQFYVHGSEAQVLAPKQKKKPRTRLPLERLENIEKIYVDPVALMGITVAVVMLIVMIVGAVQLQDAWDDYEVMSDYLSGLRLENAELTEEYRAGYDLTEIASKALALGMVPKEEVETVTITVTVPEPEPEATWWDGVVWFFSGLFA